MTNEGFKLQVSVKDTDGDMVNVRADSPEELSHYLSNFPTGEYAQFKANVRGGSSLAEIVQPGAPAPVVPQPQSGGWGNGAPAQQPQWSQPQQAAPAVPQVRLHPEGKTCSCGRTLEYKEVTRKSDQKQFKFWACPAQQKRGDGHDSEFAD